MSVLPQPRGEPIVSPNAISALANYVNNDTPEWALAGSGGGGGGQVLSQSGNSVFLSGGGGSVDIATTTSVASSALKTTAQTYDPGLLSTSFDSDLFVKRTEVGTPLEPQPLTVNGTLDVVINPTGFVRLTNLGSVFPAGQSVLYIDPILGTVGQGGAPASTWVGTATSDLNMNGYDIFNANNLTLRSDTGLLKIRSEGTGGANGVAIQSTLAPIVLSTNNEIQLSADGNIGIETSTGLVSISNPTIGNGGAQLNVNGSASIRGDTAQLQVLDSAGVQKGVLSYNSIDGQTHLDGADLAISAGESVNITAGNSDVTLLASVGSVNVESHTNIGVFCNNGGTITVGGADTGAINITTGSGGGDMTLSVPGGKFSATCDNDLSLFSGAGELSISANAGTISINAPNGTASMTSGEDVNITAGGAITTNSGSVSMTTTGGGIELHSNGGNLVLASAGDAVAISSGGGDNVSITGGTAVTLTASEGSIGITSVAGNIDLASEDGYTNVIAQTVGIQATVGGLSLTSGGTVNVTATDNVTITGGADVSISSTNATGIAQFSTPNAVITCDEATQSIIFSAPDEHLRVTNDRVSITDVPLILNAQRITGIQNVRYEHSYSTTGATLTANSSAIQTFNGTGLTATLPLVDATNVGRQFIITNIAVVGLTVASSGSQLIYYNTGSASATTRTLGPGHSQILTAIRTGVSTYGWSMV